MRQKLLITWCLARILAKDNLATSLHWNFRFSLLLLYLLQKCSSSIFVLFCFESLCNIVVWRNHSHTRMTHRSGELLTCIRRHSLLLVVYNWIGCWSELLLLSVLLDYLSGSQIIEVLLILLLWLLRSRSNRVVLFYALDVFQLSSQVLNCLTKWFLLLCWHQVSMLIGTIMHFSHLFITFIDFAARAVSRASLTISRIHHLWYFLVVTLPVWSLLCRSISMIERVLQWRWLALQIASVLALPRRLHGCESHLPG